MTLLHACAQRPTPSPEVRTPSQGIIYDYAWNEPGPILILNGKLLLGATHQDSILRELDGTMIDSIRIYPADSTTTSRFGSLGVDGVVALFTNRRL